LHRFSNTLRGVEGIREERPSVEVKVTDVEGAALVLAASEDLAVVVAGAREVDCCCVVVVDCAAVVVVGSC
jgi:hypothetical protein